MKLAGKAALVTGAGRGIGEAIAKALAASGAAVAVNDFRGDAAEAVAAAICKAGGRAIPCAGDVADPARVEAIVADTVTEFGRLDIAVSNAAYSDREAFYQADMQGFHRTIDVTMWGAFHLLRAATRQMLAQPQADNARERGCLLVIGSPHAICPVPNAMAYNMAKAAIDQMARTAAIELVDHRIRVNIVHPGWTDTPGERKFASDAELAQVARSMPWGRMARPEEIARAVLFLADPDSEYITGSTLVVDGGLGLPWWESRR